MKPERDRQWRREQDNRKTSRYKDLTRIRGALKPKRNKFEEEEDFDEDTGK